MNGTKDALVAAFQAGERGSGDALVRAHEGLVRSVARRFGHLRLQGIDFDDLCQEARVGLFYAARRRKVGRVDRKFSTEAARAMRSAVRREVETAGADVAIPIEAGMLFRKASALGLSSVDEMRRAGIVKRGKSGRILCRPSLEALFRMASVHSAVSLDEPLGGAGASAGASSKRTIGETIPSDAPRPDEILERAEEGDGVRGDLDALMRHLTRREREVLVAAVLDEARLEDIGTRFGFSKQRAGKVKNNALAKARAAALGEDVREVDIGDLLRSDKRRSGVRRSARSALGR